MKKVWLWSLILLFISFLLLSYQWTDRQNKTTTSKSNHDPVSLNVELVENSNELVITNTYIGLSESTYELMIPKYITDLSCVINDDKECFIEEGRLKITPNRTVTITYHLPIEQKDILIVNDWQIRLFDKVKEIPLSKTVSLLAPVDSNYKWVMSGSKDTSEVHKERITFFEWIVQEDVKTAILYRVPTDYKYEGQQKNIKWIAKEPIEVEKLDFFENYMNPNLIVFDKNLPTHITDYFISLPQWDEVLIEGALIESFLKQRGKISESEQWMINVVASVLYNREVETNREQELAEYLASELRNELKAQWESALLEIQYFGQNGLANILDTSLEQVFEQEVAFFEGNEKNKNKITPFYLTDARSILWNGEEVQVDWYPITIQKQLYLPLAGIVLLGDMDLYVLENRSEVIIRNGPSTYRLYLDDNRYVYNEDQYGFMEDWILTINGEIYIHRDGLEQILKIDVQQSENSIWMEQ